MSDMVHFIVRQTQNDSRSEIRKLVQSLQKVMDEAAIESQPEANLFALLRVHGDAFLALLRGEENAADLVVRAVFTATEILDKRAQKRWEAAAKPS